MLDSATGAGIAGAKVEIVRAQAPAGSANTGGRAEQQKSLIAAQEGDAAYSAVTDAQGRFRVKDVSDGAYLVRYSAARYLDEARAPSRGLGPRAATRQFQVAAGGNAVKLEGRMTQPGRISGRLINGRGEPVPDARLDLLELGGLMLSQDTDANGKFSAPLFPGFTYTLAVSPPAGLKPPDPEPGGGQLGWTRTYHPGVASAEAASKTVPQPDGGVLDIVLKLQTAPAHAVRGVVIKPDGMPAAKVAISLGEDASAAALSAASKADGTFEFAAVVDGVWRPKWRAAA